MKMAKYAGAMEPSEIRKPEISIVVPLYNKVRYVPRFAKSISGQTFANFEVIVVDDGSTDESGMVAERIRDSRFRVIHQENRGAGAARNRGIRESTAELIAFLDADDEWDPRFLQSVLDLAQKYPEAGFLATGYRRNEDSGVIKEVTITLKPGQQTHLIGNYLAWLRRANLVTSSSVTVRRSVFAEIGPFLEDEPVGEDRDMWVRISLYYQLGYDPRVLATYHTAAQGRVLGTDALRTWTGYGKSKSSYPPLVRTLRRALAQDQVPPRKRRQVRLLIDWSILEEIYWYIERRDRAMVRRLLQQGHFHTLRYRIEAILLNVIVEFLPLRLVAALKWRPKHLVERIKQTKLLSFVRADIVVTRSASREMQSGEQRVQSCESWHGVAEEKTEPN